MNHFEKVQSHLQELGISYEVVDADQELILANDEARGIKQLVIDCEYPIIVFEQFLLELKSPRAETYQRLLQINRELIHGALTVDEGGKRLIFRDTLQLENLDLNEMKGTIEALGLALAEHAHEFIAMAKGEYR